MFDWTHYHRAGLSLNNRLIVEAYKKEALKAEEKNGFSFISQKLRLKGLKVLVTAHINNGTAEGFLVEKGSMAFIKEEHLHTQAWAQKVMECDAIEGQFIIVDLNNVEFVKKLPPGQ